MRYQTTGFEDGEDFRWEGGKVIFVTVVDHDPVLEVDLDSIFLLDFIVPFRSITGGPLLIAVWEKTPANDFATTAATPILPPTAVVAIHGWP